MTVRVYENKFGPCAICLEPRGCSRPLAGAGLDLVVEGGPPEPFMVCETCIHNMLKPLENVLAEATERFNCFVCGKPIDYRHYMLFDGRFVHYDDYCFPRAR